MKHINKLRKYDERLDNFSTWTASVCMCVHILSKMLRGLQMWCLYVGVWRWGVVRRRVSGIIPKYVSRKENERAFSQFHEMTFQQTLIAWRQTPGILSIPLHSVLSHTFSPLFIRLLHFSFLFFLHFYIASLTNFILCLCPSSSLSPSEGAEWFHRIAQSLSQRPKGTHSLFFFLGNACHSLISFNSLIPPFAGGRRRRQHFFSCVVTLTTNLIITVVQWKGCLLGNCSPCD